MAIAGSRFERGTQALVRRASGTRWLRALLLHPLIARPGYWFATLGGLIWGTALSLGRIRPQGGVIVARKCPRWAFGRGGTTIGAVYLTHSALSPGVIAHEAVHRAQWKKYGLAMIPLYIAAGQVGTSNRFEIEAGLERGGYLPTLAKSRLPAKSSHDESGVRRRHNSASSLSVEEHLALILADMTPPTARKVALAETLGLTLAEDVVAPVEDVEGADDIPVRSADTALSTGAALSVGTMISAGTVLTSRDTLAAASIGRSELLVYPPLRVAVISTGSELVHAGENLHRGQIYDSNSWLLAGMVAEIGAVPVRIPAVDDDPEVFRKILERTAGTVDAVVTSGGVSVGAYDVVKAVLEPLPSMRFGTVRMQPGKPQGYGRWHDGTPIFTLPGNPVGVSVSFNAFVAPALRTMQGHTVVANSVVEAIASESWRSPAGRAQHLPIVAMRDSEGTLRVRPAARKGSSSPLVASLAEANGIAIIPEPVTEVHEGDCVTVTMMTSATSRQPKITKEEKK